MTDNKIRLSTGIPRLGPVRGEPPRKTDEPAQPSAFQQIFQQQLRPGKEVVFSQHARQRLQLRNITLTEADHTRINRAVEKAAGKGAKESLVLLDKRAFVVSVINRTVITVVDEANLKENVFTNIDSAVIM
jgi:flagellar operon protein